MNTVDLKTAFQLARASDVTYYADSPAGPGSCPNFAGVGYTATPQAFFAEAINAAVVGATAEMAILAFRGTLTINTENCKDIVPHLPPKAVLLEFLGHVEPRLSGLEARDYQHVGALEFLNWSGGITAGDSVTLDAERMAHLFGLLATGQVEEIAHDHSIESQYVPKTCAAAGLRIGE